MKTSLVLPSLLALSLFGCKAKPNPAAASDPSSPPPAEQSQNAPASSPQPRYVWKEFHAETFETHPLGAKAFLIPKRTAKVRVSIQASSGVFGGVVSKELLDEFKRKHTILRSQGFQKMPCSLMMVDTSEAVCKFDPDVQMAYIVRDARAEGTLAAGLYGFLHRSNSLAERAALPNKIRISLSTWQCVENCKSLSRLDSEVKEIYGLKR